MVIIVSLAMAVTILQFVAMLVVILSHINITFGCNVVICISEKEKGKKMLNIKLRKERVML